MKEIFHNVSKCCSAPCKYRLATIVATDKEIMVPFCCLCEKETIQEQKRLSKEQKEENKQILWRSIFPGIDIMKGN